MGGQLLDISEKFNDHVMERGHRPNAFIQVRVFCGSWYGANDLLQYTS